MYVKSLIGSVKSNRGKKNNSKKDLGIGFSLTDGIFTNEKSKII